MFKFLGFGKRKPSNPKQEAPQGAAPEPEKPGFPRASDFFTPAALMMKSDKELDQILITAAEKAQAGEPYGVALYFQLTNGSHNSQFTDQFIDELPPWAFSSFMPGEHFSRMAHAWAMATQPNQKQQYLCFKHFTILAGWRPGDINAYWLDWLTNGNKDYEFTQTGDPLGRDRLPEDIVVSPDELRVYEHLNAEAEKFSQGGGHV